MRSCENRHYSLSGKTNVVFNLYDSSQSDDSHAGIFIIKKHEKNSIQFVKLRKKYNTYTAYIFFLIR